MQWPGFVGASYQSQAWTADQERLVNRYVERMESQGATTRAALYPVPGVTLLGTGTGSPGRGHFYENSREFAVQGTTFVEINESGTVTNRGTVATSSQPATICSNGDGGGQLLITSGTNAYSYNLTTNTLTAVAALSAKATMGGYIKGYGAVLDTASSTLYLSALLNFASWTTGTDFAQRSDASDKWVSMAIHGIYIALLGEFTSEFWWNSGASFPFAPHPSGNIPYGCAAPFSVATGEGSLIWLGQSRSGQRQVYKATGFQPEPIGSLPLQLALNSYAVVNDARGEIINWLGHTFYRLTFPSADVTWCYDLSTNLWFEWGPWISEENAFAASRTQFHAMAFGQHRILDSETGSIYKLDQDSATDVDSRPIRWVRRAPAISHENQRIFCSAFELVMQTGVGTPTGQGYDPVVMMRQSRDGGQTWGTEQPASVGKTGEYGKRVRWTRLGEARQRVVEVSGSDPVPYRITEAILDLPQPIKGLPQGAAA